MKTIDRNFKTKNLKHILLSATVGILPCFILSKDLFLWYGYLYMYLGFPLLVIFFGGKTKTLKKLQLFSIGDRLYKRRKLERALFAFWISVFLCILLRGVAENRLAEILPSNFIFCLPFLTYHAFCAVFSHPLSLLKGFVLLKGRGGAYAPYNPNFPSSQRSHSHSKVFSHHSVKSHSYKFSSSSSSSSRVNNQTKPFDYYFHPISPGYIGKK